MENKKQVIKIHSITDLITNSSTTIYTLSDASKDAAIDMINSFFQAFGINLKALLLKFSLMMIICIMIMVLIIII